MPNASTASGPASSDSGPRVVASQSLPNIPMKHRLWVIRQSLRAILVFVAVCTLITTIVSLKLRPTYEATATIDVDRRAPTGVVGQDAVTSDTGDAEQFLNTQVRLIQSDSVLRPVLQMFGMHKAAGIVGFEGLKVSRPANTFLILVSYQCFSPTLSADFTNAVAKSYIEQTYNLRYRASLSLSTFMERQIAELRAKMDRSSQALTRFEQDLNMVRPEETNGIVSARLLQLNTEYTSAQADRAKKEAAYDSLREGQLEAAEVSVQGEPLRRLLERLGDAWEKFAEAGREYGKNHPEFKKAAGKVKQLTGELEQAKTNVMLRARSEYREALHREQILKRSVEETKLDFDRLNVRAFQYQNLRREAEADRKLYEELTNRIKEAGINAGFQNSSIRLADPAQPPEAPVFPDVPRRVELALLSSFALGIFIALAVDATDSTLRSSEDVERVLETNLIGTLPLVRHWGESWRFMAGRVSPQLDHYENAVMTLRNSILLGSPTRPIRTLLVTSASPAEGKSTTAVHLAVAHAQQLRKTLLIDCDLRRPGIPKVLRMNSSVGLSRLLTEGSDWQQALVRHDRASHLDILPAGAASRDAAGLVGNYLPQILLQASSIYDLIVIDSPPVLPFPEPLQLAAAVDGVLLVALAGKTNRKAVAAAATALRRLPVNLLGVVLNEVSRKTASDYYPYTYGSPS
jgi:polysaccharide biosynthesis transport protein